MKKIAIASLIALASVTSMAADYLSFDIDHVRDMTTKQLSTAEYLRAGKEIAGLQFGIQDRTAVYQGGGGTFTSIETTVGKNIGIVQPYVGLGYDNGVSGKPTSHYNYGLLGAQVGVKAGPGFALVGAKTRVNDAGSTNPKQSVAYATYSIPVAKGVAVNINASKSYQTITENAYGLGVGFSF
jgi:hypothetical protein